jgi:hypothetical protein
MQDHGNNPDWYISASGDRYHRKATARRIPKQPTEERHPLYGPGTGRTDVLSRKVDRLFDGIITVIVVGVGAAVAVAMLGMLRAPDPALEPERDTIECQR